MTNAVFVFNFLSKSPTPTSDAASATAGSDSDTSTSSDTSRNQTPAGSNTPTGEVPGRDRSGTIIARPIWDATTTRRTLRICDPQGTISASTSRGACAQRRKPRMTVMAILTWIPRKKQPIITYACVLYLIHGVCPDPC